MERIAEPKKEWDPGFQGDEIGPWSEVKLDIVRQYAAKYSSILSSQRDPSFKHFYIDAFAGAGIHLTKERGEFVAGSPLNALWVEPPFAEYHFVELQESKLQFLEEVSADFPNVSIHKGDCNAVLLDEVFPRVRFKKYERALCLLDPYGLDLDWRVIEAAGASHSIEIFLNFPAMDINRNVLRKNEMKVDAAQEERMTRFWGDESWRQVGRQSKSTLFGDVGEKVTNEQLAQAFRERLKKVAGFPCVPKPCAMKNSRGAVVYYLYFAAHKPVAADIVDHIFRKYGGA